MKKKSLFILLFIFSLKHFGQVGIGTEDPHPSAILDINSKDKGVLLPQVTLKNARDTSSIPNPSVRLLVYNTGKDSNFPVQGYMFWDGTEWRFITDGAAVQPEILGSITSTLLTPNEYNTTDHYVGYLEVNYIGGNGGYYSKGEPYTHDGLTYELQPGKLESSGTLVYKVTGTSPVSSPNKIPQVPIYFPNTSTELGREDIGGEVVIQTAQYTLFDEGLVSEGVSGVSGVEKGYGGSLMTWGKNGNEQSVILPETGSYSFSFRLYGEAQPSKTPPSTTNHGIPFYVAGFKQVDKIGPQLVGSDAINSIPMIDELLDMAEIIVSKPSNYSKLTYSVNLTISGKKGDKIYFTIAGLKDKPYQWYLKNGERNDKVADRTSMIFWKL